MPEQAESKKGDSVDVATLKESIREAEAMMRTTDAIFDLEAQLHAIAQGKVDGLKLTPREKKIIRNAELEKMMIRKRQLQRDVDNRIADYKNRGVAQRVLRVATSPRALQSTADMSAVLRQGLWLVLNRPQDFPAAFLGALRATFDENAQDEIAIGIENHPNYLDLVHADLKIVQLDGKPTNAEDDFVTNAAERIPGWGPVVRASNRNMITFLNIMRTEAFNAWMDAHPDMSLDEKKAVANMINLMSGRGNLGKAEAAIMSWNAVFYAPRWTVSRYTILAAPFTSFKHPEARKFVAQAFGKYIGAQFALLSLAKILGLEVGDDPEDWTFMRIKIGKTWYDFTGGMNQPIRLVALLGKGLLRGTGWVTFSKNYDPMRTALQMARYKLSPTVTIPVELASGKDWRGEDVEVWETGMRAVMPITLASVTENVFMRPDVEIEEAVMPALSEFFGAPATTPEPKSRRSTSPPRPRGPRNR